MKSTLHGTAMRRCLILLTGLAAMTTTACRSGFTATERETIRRGGDGIMRVMSIADRTDSLVLRRRSAPVDARTASSEDFALLRRRMMATVRDPQNEGVGIAAPQVGILRRVIAVQRFDKAGEPFGFYINPEILAATGSAEAGREGCLSVPDIYGTVERPHSITLRYRDERFEQVTETVEGFTAVIFQHEIDHLDGILFIDRMRETPRDGRQGTRADTTKQGR